ncbi:uncharacterized protein [Miscanthus floridulus]|uniref:uncharacterized protein n=1 Tax=Miscanthus floridulus TaxID=154761 RepID=UPI00345913CA
MPAEEILIKADSIADAATEIISFLEGTGMGRSLAYFDGWFGLGASAVLKAIVKRLRSSSSRGSTTGLTTGLNKIIHIDCSLWQSKRALQKAIAEELQLPQHMMAIFDHHDEADNFDGVEESARGVIPLVTKAIMDNLYNHRFLVVFHNGSGEYIDLSECGVPVIGLLGKRVLWTSRGRFRLHGIQDEDVKKLAGMSDFAISADLSSDLIFDRLVSLLHAEAMEVTSYIGMPEPDLSPKIAMECFLYTVLMRGEDCGIDWTTHAANYWVCDGIIQTQTTNNGNRSAWEIADALHRNMNLQMDWHPIWVVNIRDVIGLCCKQWECCDRWVSANRKNVHYQQHHKEKEGKHYDIAVAQVPPQVTSFFCSGAGAGPLVDNNNATTTLEAGIFDHSDRSMLLSVIHLSYCTFSFSRPPFLSCSNLRFLLLDHCKNKDMSSNHGGDEEHHEHNNHDSGACFRKLWVLDLSYTDWYWLLSKEMMDLMTELRELSVKGVKNWSISQLDHRHFGVKSNSYWLLNLSKLRVTAEPGVPSSVVAALFFPDLSSSSIKTIILDGCAEMEKLGHDAVPPSLESFSFTCGYADTKMKSFSFRACAKFETLLLRGLFRNLLELDLSGTAVKTLDLSAIQASRLRRLFLMGCEKLCAILWPQEGNNKLELEVLRMDTTQTTIEDSDDDDSVGLPPSSSSTTTTIEPCSGRRAPTNFHVYIFLGDTRLLRSLLHVGIAKYLHVEISSKGAYASSHSTGVDGGCKGSSQGRGSCGEQVPVVSSLRRQKQTGSTCLYGDGDNIIPIPTTFEDAGVGGAPAITSMWPCPPIPFSNSWVHCYISIQEDELRTGLLQEETNNVAATTTLPDFVHDKARTLYLHDSLFVTCIPGHTSPSAIDLGWGSLWWCRLERCPNLQGTVFSGPRIGGRFNVFVDLKAFWASQLPKARYIWDWSMSSFRPGYWSFNYLVFLHLENCPRLLHVLPLCPSNNRGCYSLETLEIICCGDLREVFPLLDPAESEQQQIIKPRSFPSLRRIHLHELSMLRRICGRMMFAPNLEIVRIRGCWGLKRLPAVARRSTRPAAPVVDCEKEWWDSLEWDGEKADHHPSRYKPTHSAYHKKTLHRASVLR